MALSLLGSTTCSIRDFILNGTSNKSRHRVQRPQRQDHAPLASRSKPHRPHWTSKERSLQQLLPGEGAEAIEPLPSRRTSALCWQAIGLGPSLTVYPFHPLG